MRISSILLKIRYNQEKLKMKIKVKMKIFTIFSVFLALFTFVPINDSFAACSKTCGTTSLAQGWVFQPLYSVTKAVYHNEEGQIVKEEPIDWDIGLDDDHIGNKYVDDPRYPSKFTYQLFNLIKTQSTNITPDIIEIEFDNFRCEKTNGGLCDAAKLIIKQLPLDLGFGEKVGDVSGRVGEIIAAIEDPETGSTVSRMVDNDPDSYCPLGKSTVRFKVTIEKSESWEKAVIAIGFPSDQFAYFGTSEDSEDIFDAHAYKCISGDCIKPDVTDCPRNATSENCIAYDTGKVEDIIVLGTKVHFKVPEQYVEGRVYQEDCWLAKLPENSACSDLDLASGRYIFTQETLEAKVNFSNGTSIDLPNNCKFVYLANKIGSNWAEWKIITTVSLVEFPSGKECRETLTETGRWEWWARMRGKPFIPRALSIVDLPPYFSIPLTVTKAGTGKSTIRSTPGNIECSIGCMEMTEMYHKDTVVTLSATSDDIDSEFSGWSGACSGTNPQTTVTMDADKSCTANFTKVTINFIPGETTEVPKIAERSTGAMMEGMRVKAIFSDGFHEDLTWKATGLDSGGVFGDGWSLTENGDTLGSFWTLELDSSIERALNFIWIDALAGNTVFDTGFEYGTPGTDIGWTFTVLSAPFDLDLQVTYWGMVALDDQLPVGDIYGNLGIRFANPGGFAAGDTLTFIADTDFIPEPSTLLLLGSGLIGVLALRRKRLRN